MRHGLPSASVDGASFWIRLESLLLLVQARRLDSLLERNSGVTQAKTRGVQKEGSVFEVGIIRGLSRLDRAANCQNGPGCPKGRRVHSQRDSGLSRSSRGTISAGVRSFGDIPYLSLQKLMMTYDDGCGFHPVPNATLVAMAVSRAVSCASLYLFLSDPWRRCILRFIAVRTIYHTWSWRTKQRQANYAVPAERMSLLVCQVASAKVSAFRYFLSSSTTSVVWSVVRREVVPSSCLHILLWW